MTKLFGRYKVCGCELKIIPVKHLLDCSVGASLCEVCASAFLQVIESYWCSFCVCQLFTSNLVTRSASAENAADAERSIGDVEHTRVGAVADREMFESSDRTLLISLF